MFLNEDVLFSATPDLILTVSLHRNAALDVEPIYTFRAHRWVQPENNKNAAIFFLKMND